MRITNGWRVGVTVRRWVGMAVAAWFFGGGAGLPSEAVESSSKSMKSIDALFMADYAIAQKAMTESVTQTGLIVVNGADLLLYLNGKRVEQVKGNFPPSYENLKTIGHVPLAVFVLLITDSNKGALSTATRSRVESFITALEAMTVSLTPDRFPAQGSLDRQRFILQSSLDMLRQTLEAGRISKQGLVHFARSQRAALEGNFPGAVGAQLRSVDETVRRWRRERLTAEQWDSIRVVVLGAATAHRRELHLQYFSKVMGIPMEGTDRLMYYEGFDLEGALELVGRFRLDGEASQAFFDDPSHLFSDIFANTTRDWLEVHATGVEPASNTKEATAGSER